MPQVTSPEGDAAEEMLVVVAESCRGNFVCRSSFFSVTNFSISISILCSSRYRK